MYLVERVLGVLTYMIILLIMTFLIYKSSPDKLKKYLIIYLILLFIMAYFYIPASSADLYRLTKTMNNYASLSLVQLKDTLLKSMAPAYILYFYIIGKLGVDNLLPAITSLIFYGIIFTILYKSSKRFNLSNKSVAISLLFFMEMGKFLEVISSIRTMLAFAIIAFCCYTEFIENKKIYKNLIFYLIASFLHPAAMILVLFRILFLLFQKEKKFIRRLFNIMLLIFIVFFLVRYGNATLSFLYDKADTYLSGNVYSYIWEYLISFLAMGFTLFTLITQKKFMVNSYEMKKISSFLLYVCIIVMFFCYEYSIFTRFQVFASILFVPVFSYVLDSMEKRNVKNKYYSLIFIFVSAIIFIVAGTRGNLSGYKYILFN